MAHNIQDLRPHCSHRETVKSKISECLAVFEFIVARIAKLSCVILTLDTKVAPQGLF